jgi:transcriptional regulator with XRE-family HTH domain
MEIKRESLSRAINGNPTLETLKKIADALEVSVPELFAPENSTDFTAFIDNKGELKRFNSIEDLKKYLETS